MSDNRDIELLAALGVLTRTWSAFEFKLFTLFDALLGAKTYKARILWFNLSNLQMRLKLMRSIARESSAEYDCSQSIDEKIKVVGKLSEQRNDYVHRLWAKGDGGWQMIALRDPSSPSYVVKVAPEEILAFVYQISELDKQISDLAVKLRAVVPRSD